MATTNLDDLNAQQGTTTAQVSPPTNEDELELGAMTIVEHLEELRRRIIYSLIAIAVCTIGAFIFWGRILAFLLLPLPTISNHLVGSHQLLIQTHVGEAFTVALKLSLAVGIVIAMPVVLYQTWAFIAPALTRRERKYAAPFTVLGVGLFAIGIVVGYIVLRYPVEWLVNFGKDQFTLLLDGNAYLTFVAYFLLAFGLIFELPLILTFMGVVGIINSRILRAKRMYILFGLWVISCFITPGADPYSPVIIGVCFTVLFELTVILLRIMKK